MISVQAVYDLLQEKAPFELQLGFDNAGFLVGRGDAPVSRILVSLDITEPVIQEARELGAELIVSHHPVIWGGAKTVTDQTPTGRKLLAMAENHIAGICAHTNLDAVADGVNDALARRLGLEDIAQLKQDGVDGQGRPYGIGRIGTVQEQPLYDFALFVKETLGSNGIRLVDGGKPVHKVGGGRRFLLRYDRGRTGSGLRHLRDRGCEIRWLSGCQGPGAQSDRCRTFPHGGRGVPCAERLADRPLPRGGGGCLQGPPRGVFLSLIWIRSGVEEMAKSQIKAMLPWDVQKVWQMVTDVGGYSWRSDLSRTEVLSETRFIEYTKEGYPTTFTVTRSEPCRRWEFDMENSNMRGHWVGIFTQDAGNTSIEFTEAVTAKKFFLRPFVASYLRKQQARFVADLKLVLSQMD